MQTSPSNRRRQVRYRANRKGSILILVLFIMIVLSVVAVSFAYRAGLESRLTYHRSLMVKLRSHAHSAVAIALLRLRNNTNDFDHPAEAWHTHSPLSEEGWLGDWSASDNGRAAEFVTTYSVMDEEGKLNLQYASSQALEDFGMSSSQIACLMDWMDSNDVEQSEGAENPYYAELPEPYQCGDTVLSALSDLLKIRGFSSAGYHGEDADCDGRLDENEDDGDASDPPDDGDGELRLGWLGLLTCVGNGTINLNTAPEAVLDTLHLSEGAVGQIVGYRFFDSDSGGEVANHAFRSVSDIMQLQGLTGTDRNILTSIARFRSEYFRIIVRSRHIRTGLRYRVEVLVRMKGTKPEILKWHIGR